MVPLQCDRAKVGESSGLRCYGFLGYSFSPAKDLSAMLTKAFLLYSKQQKLHCTLAHSLQTQLLELQRNTAKVGEWMDEKLTQRITRSKEWGNDLVLSTRNFIGYLASEQSTPRAAAWEEITQPRQVINVFSFYPSDPNPWAPLMFVLGSLLWSLGQLLCGWLFSWQIF